jgi:hypothetical protein
VELAPELPPPEPLLLEAPLAAAPPSTPVAALPVAASPVPAALVAAPPVELLLAEALRLREAWPPQAAMANAVMIAAVLACI